MILMMVRDQDHFGIHLINERSEMATQRMRTGINQDIAGCKRIAIQLNSECFLSTLEQSNS